MNVENDIIQTELIEKDILLNRKCFIRFLMDKNHIRLYINIFYKTFQVFSFYRIAEKYRNENENRSSNVLHLWI